MYSFSFLPFEKGVLVPVLADVDEPVIRRGLVVVLLLHPRGLLEGARRVSQDPLPKGFN